MTAKAPLDKYKADFITRFVAHRHGVSESLIRGESRLRHISRARQEAMVLCTMTGASLKEVGKYFNRDHTTVMHAQAAVKNNGWTIGLQRKQLEACLVAAEAFAGKDYKLEREIKDLKAALVKTEGKLAIYENRYERAYGLVSLRQELSNAKDEIAYYKSLAAEARQVALGAAPFSNFSRDTVAA